MSEDLETWKVSGTIKQSALASFCALAPGVSWSTVAFCKTSVLMEVREGWMGLCPHQQARGTGQLSEAGLAQL